MPGTPRAEQSLCTPRACARSLPGEMLVFARRGFTRRPERAGGGLGPGPGCWSHNGTLPPRSGLWGDVTAAPGRAGAPCTRGAHVAAWQGCPGWRVSLRPGRCVFSLALARAGAFRAGAAPAGSCWFFLADDKAGRKGTRCSEVGLRKGNCYQKAVWVKIQR